MMEERALSAGILSSLIRGEPPSGPSFSDPAFLQTLTEAADYHGVRLLIAHRLRQSKRGDGNIRALAENFLGFERSGAAIGLIQEKQLSNTIDTLTRRGVSPLLIKGTPLAYSHYPSPELRPRADTDLLVPTESRDPARTILRDLGYRLSSAESGQLARHQFNAEKRDQFGVEHVLDVHWKLSNHQAFAGLFSYDELARASVPIPQLGENARALGPVHALVLACIHRVAHIHSPLYIDGVPRYGGDRLIWLYDIHLLLTRMSPDQLERFAALAVEKRIGAVCFDGMQRAHRHFGTRLPAVLVKTLSAIDVEEPSARYLVPGRLRFLMTELGAHSDWNGKLRYLQDLAFPASGYILRKYEVSGRLWLPLLYLHRALLGLWKLAGLPARSQSSRADHWTV